MRIRPPLPGAILLLALSVLAATPVRAESIRQVAADDRGITLELAIPSWVVGPARADGRSYLTVPGLEAKASPGRPVLPSATTLIALPPGARPALGSIEAAGQESRDGVRLQLGDRRGFVDDPQLGKVPFAEPSEPILDGPWPASPVELGAPFSLRGQRLVAVTLKPFRYDETTQRLSVTQRLRVRIEFAGATAGAGAPAPRDARWDAVLKGAVLNFEQGRRWRTAPAPAVTRPREGSLFDRAPAGPAGPTGVAEFDEGEPEVRIRIDTTGVYQLTYDQLAANGYQSGVPVEQVSVHRHEFKEDARPSYDTIELPIEVDEAAPADGIFNSGDRIVVYVQTWAERSGATLPQRNWGDAEVIYATRVFRSARRIDVRVGWLDLVSPTPLASYPWTQRWEQNLTHTVFPGTFGAESLFDNFHWTSQIQYYNRPDFPFETNHLDQGRSVIFTLMWQGRRNNSSYFAWGQVRNGSGTTTMVADSVFWAGRNNYPSTVTMPGTALTEGRTNAFVQYGRTAGPPPGPANSFATAMLNWFEATYWRSYRGIAGYLDCNSADASGPFEVLARGFSSQTPLRAYDVTDPTDPRLLTGTRREDLGGGEFGLRFQDDATIRQRRYIVFAQPRPVPASRISPVERTALFTDQVGDYLLIVPEAWQTVVQPLKAHRDAQNHNVLISPVEKIYDEFNGGRRSPHAIRRFIRYALNNWNARFVLLAGDGSEDPQGFIGDSGPDIIPVFRIPGPVQTPPDGREMVPSDGWYVWCLNGCPDDPVSGTPPILPELFLGRLPVTSTQELADAVDKLIKYDALNADQDWRHKLLLLADDEYSESSLGFPGDNSYCLRFWEDRFLRLNHHIATMIADSAGLRRTEIDLFDLSWWLRDEVNNGANPPCRPNLIVTQNNTRAYATNDLFTRLNNGRMWWNFQGHANEFVLAHENIYRNLSGQDDKDRLINDDMPFLFSAFSCHANAFARVGERRPGLGPPMGEEMAVLPKRGAIASWASVGFEIIPDNGTDHINVAWARAMFLDPPHDDLFGNGDTGARTLLAETIALGLMRYIPGVKDDATENALALTYTLLGDPAIPLSIGLPQAIVTVNGDTVVSDRPLTLSEPRDSVFLEADIVSTVEIRSIALIEASAAGSRTVPEADYTMTPPFPDSGPTGSGGRRYHLSYVTPLRAGVTRYTIRAVDRYGLRNDFNIVFPFSTELRVSDNRMVDNDVVTPTADLSLKVTLPTPIADPQTQMALEVDSLAQVFTASAIDTTRRSYILRWTHTPYAAGSHIVELTALDSLYSVHRFRVEEKLAAGDRMLRDVIAFPNPFEDQIGSAFSYYLFADAPADVLLKVFTVTGRLVYQRVERALTPGYHQWPWDGRDADGDLLANGVYLYRMVATTGSQSDTFDGRLVKLRKPRRGTVTTP